MQSKKFFNRDLPHSENKFQHEYAFIEGEAGKDGKGFVHHFEEDQQLGCQMIQDSDGCQFDQRTGRLRLKGKVLKHVIVNTGEVDLQLDSEIATEAVSKSTSTKHVQMRRITIFEIDLDQTWPLDIPSREPIAGQECWSYTRELMPVDDVQNASEALEKAKRASFDPERQF